MKLGIGLPNTMAHETDRRLMLDWARLADQAGFHELAVIDKPNYDSWDPLATLAAAAAVTERARLATTILQLPNRDEVLVTKQAATIDRVSNGRLDLGVAVGAERTTSMSSAHLSATAGGNSKSKSPGSARSGRRRGRPGRTRACSARRPCRNPGRRSG